MTHGWTSKVAAAGNAPKGTLMYDQATFHMVANDRIAAARRSADLHRLRIALRRDPRSVMATQLQRLALRLDARTGCDAVTRDSFATDRELCRAA